MYDKTYAHFFLCGSLQLVPPNSKHIRKLSLFFRYPVNHFPADISKQKYFLLTKDEGIIKLKLTCNKIIFAPAISTVRGKFFFVAQ